MKPTTRRKLGWNKVKRVVFLEVKTGKYVKLTDKQKCVRDCVEARQVEWQLFEIPQSYCIQSSISSASNIARTFRAPQSATP